MEIKLRKNNNLSYILWKYCEPLGHLKSNLVTRVNISYRLSFDPLFDVNFIEIKDYHIRYMCKDSYFIAVSVCGGGKQPGVRHGK